MEPVPVTLQGEGAQSVGQFIPWLGRHKDLGLDYDSASQVSHTETQGPQVGE